jgi:hypothetical protein
VVKWPPPAHAAHDRRREGVIADGVPIHDLAQVGQGTVGDRCTVFFLDAVKQADDFGALDGTDRTIAQRREHQAFQRAAAITRGPELVTFTLEIFVDHSRECVCASKPRRLASLIAGDTRIGALLQSVKAFYRFAPCRCQRDVGLERQLAAASALRKPIANEKRFMSGRLNADAQATAGRDLVIRCFGPQRAQSQFSDHPVRHAKCRAI